jgi:hypothetical protein
MDGYRAAMDKFLKQTKQLPPVPKVEVPAEPAPAQPKAELKPVELPPEPSRFAPPKAAELPEEPKKEKLNPAQAVVPSAMPILGQRRETTTSEEIGRTAFWLSRSAMRPLTELYDWAIAGPTGAPTVDEIFPAEKYKPTTITGNLTSAIGAIISVDAALTVATAGGWGVLKASRYGRQAAELERAISASRAAAATTKLGVAAARGTTAVELVTPDEEASAGFLRSALQEMPGLKRGISNYLRDGKDETWDQQVVQFVIDTAENAGIDYGVGKAMNKLRNLKNNKKVLKAAVSDPQTPDAFGPESPKIDEPLPAPADTPTTAKIDQPRPTRKDVVDLDSPEAKAILETLPPEERNAAGLAKVLEDAITPRSVEGTAIPTKAERTALRNGQAPEGIMPDGTPFWINEEGTYIHADGTYIDVDPATVKTFTADDKFDPLPDFESENIKLPPQVHASILANTGNIIPDFMRALNVSFEGLTPLQHQKRGDALALLLYTFTSPKNRMYSDTQKNILLRRLAETSSNDDPLMVLAGKTFLTLMGNVYKDKTPKMLAAIDRISPNFFKTMEERLLASGSARFNAIRDDIKRLAIESESAESIQSILGAMGDELFTGPMAVDPSPEQIKNLWGRLSDVTTDSTEAVDLILTDMIPKNITAELNQRVTEGIAPGPSPLRSTVGAVVETPKKPNPANYIDDEGKIVGAELERYNQDMAKYQESLVQSRGQSEALEFDTELVEASYYSAQIDGALEALSFEAPQHLARASQIIQRAKILRQHLAESLIKYAKDPAVQRVIKGLEPTNQAYETALEDSAWTIKAMAALDSGVAANIDRIRAGATVAVNNVPKGILKFPSDSLAQAQRDIREMGMEQFKNHVAEALMNTPQGRENVQAIVRNFYGKKYPQYADFTLPPAAETPNGNFDVLADTIEGNFDIQDIQYYLAARAIGDTEGMKRFNSLNAIMDGISGRWSDKHGRFAEYFVGEKDGKFFIKADTRTYSGETDFKTMVEAEHKAFSDAYRKDLMDGPEIENYKKKLDFLYLATRDVKDLTPQAAQKILDMSVAVDAIPWARNVLGEAALYSTGGIGPAVTTGVFGATKAIWNTLTDIPAAAIGTPSSKAEARVSLYVAWKAMQNIKKTLGASGVGILDALQGGARIVEDVDIAMNVSPAHIAAIKNAEAAIRASEGLTVFDRLMRGGLGAFGKGAVAFKDLMAKRLITAGEMAVANVRYQNEILTRWTTDILTKDPSLTVEAAFKQASDKYNTYVQNYRSASAASIYRSVFDDAKKAMPNASDADVTAYAQERFRAAWSENDIVEVSRAHAEIMAEQAESSVIGVLKDPKAKIAKTGFERATANVFGVIKDLTTSPIAMASNIVRNTVAFGLEKTPYDTAKKAAAVIQTDSHVGLLGTISEKLRSTDPRTRVKAHATATIMGAVYAFAYMQAGDDDPYTDAVVNPPLPANPQLAKQMLDAGYVEGAVRVGDKQVPLPYHARQAYLLMYKTLRKLRNTSPDEREMREELGDIVVNSLTALFKAGMSWNGNEVEFLTKVIGDERGTGPTFNLKQSTFLQFLTDMVFPGYATIKAVTGGVTEVGRAIGEDQADVMLADAARRERESSGLRQKGIDWFIPERRTTSLGTKQMGGRTMFSELDTESPTYQMGVQGIPIPKVPTLVGPIDLTGSNEADINTDASKRKYASAYDEFLDVLNESEMNINPEDPSQAGSTRATLRDALSFQMRRPRDKEQHKKEVDAIMRGFLNIAYDNYANPTNKRFNKAFAERWNAWKGGR